MTDKYGRCTGKDCPKKLMLEPYEAFCTECGTQNPNFSEAELAEEVGGRKLEEVLAEECTPEMHVRAVNELIADSAKDNEPRKTWFCPWCGTLLISDYKSAVSVTA